MSFGRALSIADRTLDVVEEALEDKDPQVRLRASGQFAAHRADRADGDDALGVAKDLVHGDGVGIREPGRQPL